MSDLFPPVPPSDLDWPEGCPVDPRRVVVLRGGEPRRRGRYVLYWCQVQKRAEWHPGLDYAAAQADALGVPLVVYEGLRPDYPHASWRHHRFILDGTRSLAGRLMERGIAHWFYLSPAARSERIKMVQELGAQAKLVVTDDYPAFVVPGHNAAAAKQLDCPLHAVDASGVAPLRAFARQTAAFTLRPRLRRLLPELLAQPDPLLVPRRDSLGLKLAALPGLVRGDTLPDDGEELDRLIRTTGVDPSVRPAAGVQGGRAAGLERLRRFIARSLGVYAEGRNRASVDVTSNLSPYLHYGMLSPVEIAKTVRELAPPPRRRAEPAQPDGDDEHDGPAAFLEELLVRRELALNFCLHTPEHQSLDALPAWARENLERHAVDPRRPSYDLKTLERAATGDPLWNAIQTELVELGEPHGYLRMLWGKKIIEWAPTYKDALAWMIRLNDRYAYDGRDAVSYANFLWCFGLHDRPFPRRPIFGVMRPMSSASTGKKAGGAEYIERVRAEVRARGSGTLQAMRAGQAGAAAAQLELVR